MPALIGSENAGDFHDWPETWQRSSDASENSWTGAVYHCKTLMLSTYRATARTSRRKRIS